MTKPRTKHIAMSYHWIRDKIKEKCFKLKYIPSKENKADLFTEVLSKHQQDQDQLLERILDAADK